MKFPSMRVLLTATLLCGWFGFETIYHSFEGPIEGKMSVAQLEDNDVTYGVARKIVVDDAICDMVSVSISGLLVLLWGSWFWSNRKNLLRIRDSR